MLMKVVCVWPASSCSAMTAANATPNALGPARTAAPAVSSYSQSSAGSQASALSWLMFSMRASVNPPSANSAPASQAAGRVRRNERRASV